MDDKLFYSPQWKYIFGFDFKFDKEKGLSYLLFVLVVVHLCLQSHVGVCILQEDSTLLVVEAILSALVMPRQSRAAGLP